MAPCSVKHGGLQYCFECPEYPCRNYDGFDSYDTLVLHRNQRKDMQKAKEIGMETYHAEQREKKEIKYMKEFFPDTVFGKYPDLGHAGLVLLKPELFAEKIRRL